MPLPNNEKYVIHDRQKFNKKKSKANKFIEQCHKIARTKKEYIKKICPSNVSLERL